MIKETFIDYLSKKHADSYMGTDDNMPDDFDNYLSNLSIDQAIDLADEWTANVIEFAQIRIKEIKGVYSAHDALTEIDKVLETLK